MSNDNDDSIWLALETVQRVHKKLDHLTLKAIEAAVEWEPSYYSRGSEEEFKQSIKKALDNKLEAKLLEVLGIKHNPWAGRRGQPKFVRDDDKQTNVWSFITARIHDALESHLADWTLEKIKKDKRYKTAIAAAEVIFVDSFYQELEYTARREGQATAKRVASHWNKHLHTALTASFAKENPVLTKLTEEMRAQEDPDSTDNE